MNGIKAEKDVSSEEDEVQMTDPQFIDLMQQLEGYTPTIPDGVAEHYLNKAGVNTDDPRIVRLVSLSAQKFIADILNDVMQLNKMKGSAQSARSNKAKDKKMILTMEDLTSVLAERGIKVKKPLYYT